MSTAVVDKRACPGCGADLSGTHGRRKWCSETCRKNTSYGGTCESCGARTSGRDGRAKAPKHCPRCAPSVHAKWPRERIIEAIREWARLYGKPPTSREWHPAIAARQRSPRAAEIAARYAAGDWPATSTVMNRWPSWNDAIAAAGFEPRPALRPECEP